MCDCYNHKCECCEELIPMHIGDFKYPRTDFQVWCGKHIDKAPAGSVIFEAIDPDDEDEPLGWKCAILGPEVGLDPSEGNAPNSGAMMECSKIK